MKQRYKVAGIGELLWDILPSGKHAGGAPFNFAFHARQANCESYIISAVGNDQLGIEITEKVKTSGIRGEYIQKNRFPTGTVTIALTGQGNPTYTVHEQVAWDHIQWNTEMKMLAKEVDAVCFGSLAQRTHESRITICSFLGELSPRCLKVFDINLRQDYFNKETILKSLWFSDILKLNEDELPVFASYFEITGKPLEQLRQLMQKFNLKYVAYTIGNKGSILISPEECSVLNAPAVKVVDTVGAGDSFTAFLVAGILQEKPIREVHQKANEAAAYVCTQKGATPILPQKIISQKSNLML